MSFELPEVIYIVENNEHTRTMYNENEDYVALSGTEFDGEDPGYCGYTVEAEVAVIHKEGAYYPGTFEQWIASVCERALEAYKTGGTSINL